MIISLVAAVSENNVIGNNNQLIWYLPADLMHFKALTFNHHIVMGRKTFESIGKALPARTNVVITKNKKFSYPGIKIVHSLEDAIKSAKANKEKECFIIGGGEIYQQALPLADKIYLTRIHKSFIGDTEFPYFDMDKWKILEQEDHEPDNKNKYGYSFITYVKK